MKEFIGLIIYFFFNYIDTVIVLITSIVILFLFICFLAYLKAFYNNQLKKSKKMKMPGKEQYAAVKHITDMLVNEMTQKKWEDIYINSYDGLILHGRYHHISDVAPLQIQCHGYKGSWKKDFCGGNKLATDTGFNTLVIDQRAHGKSGGKTITFGIKERYDLMSWIKYSVKRFGENKKIVLAGVSMGASTVLMVSDMQLPESVKCIIADSPYSSPKAIILKVCNDMKIPSQIAYPFVKMGALLFGRFHLNASSAVEAVKKSKKPILLIHGKNDLFVPYSMSEEIYNNAESEKQLEYFENAGHGLSYLIDTERYNNVVNVFIKKHLL